MKISIPTKGILNAKQTNLMLSKLIYSIEGISDCHMDPHTYEIIVEMLPNSDRETIEQTIDHLIGMERNKRVIDNRTFIESKEASGISHQTQTIEEIYPRDASVCRDLAVILFEQMDSIFTRIAQQHHAQLRKYPTMIPIEKLDKCKYISSFPQNIHLVSEIPHRLEALEQVKQTEKLEDIVRLSPYALSPAVCFHCYAELSGCQLFEPLLLTARGICCRHEASWRLGGHRSNEFTMREIVFMGDSGFVEKQRTTLMEQVWELFIKLGLSGRIETASDPFYFSEDYEKGQHQLAAQLKYELITDMGQDCGAFSIASFNHMGDSLCKPFQIIDRLSNPLHSGCVAFGIDRWVYTLLLTYGPHYEEWPSHVRIVLEK